MHRVLAPQEIAELLVDPEWEQSSPTALRPRKEYICGGDRHYRGLFTTDAIRGLGSLVIDSDGRPNAIDLKSRHDEVQRWFSGKPVYGGVRATYPPQSFVLLWPFLGWMTLSAARWLWAIPAWLHWLG